MADLSLVMPMAGRGSRFMRNGQTMPKPLIDLDGRPFFWWAAESVARVAKLNEIVFVVLDEHIAQFQIDAIILGYYPQARIVALPDVTDGAAETAALGVAALTTGTPFAVNDCDHAFALCDIGALTNALTSGVSGALVGFRSSSTAYSYVRLDTDQRVTGTVEKQVVSPFAIAGCYFFADRTAFATRFEAYRASCPYDELFLSGIFNMICDESGEVAFQELKRHVSFGTPEELAQVDVTALRALWE